MQEEKEEWATRRKKRPYMAKENFRVAPGCAIDPWRGSVSQFNCLGNHPFPSRLLILVLRGFLRLPLPLKTVRPRRSSSFFIISVQSSSWVHKTLLPYRWDAVARSRACYFCCGVYSKLRKPHLRLSTSAWSNLPHVTDVAIDVTCPLRTVTRLGI